MKLLFTKKLFFLFCISAVSLTTAKGQTTLAAGDIAFTGYIGHGTGPTAIDDFSFVLLKNITSNTVINFTENGWLIAPNPVGFRTGENTLTWTSNSALVSGQEIKIVGTTPSLAGGAGTAGTVTGTAFALSANGDQVLAYQGTSATPTFISAIHMNVYDLANIPDPSTTTAAAWDGVANTSNSSALPPGLTTGVNAIWIGTQGNINSEKDNARFICAGNLSTAASIKALIYDQTKWTTSDNEPVGFTLPSGCNFIGVLPIKLISFKAKNILTDAQLNWLVAEQIDFSHFELERSFEGSDFKYLATIAALPGAGTIDYAYTDKAALKANVSTIYYRLKMVDIDGKTTYSDIVKLSNNKQKDFEITNFQNPLMGNKIKFELLTKGNQKASFSITDLYGRQLYKMQQNCTAGRNQIAFSDNLMLSSGVYFLNIQLDNEAMQSIKFVKN
jgi:hypothetical protein